MGRVPAHRTERAASVPLKDAGAARGKADAIQAPAPALAATLAADQVGLVRARGTNDAGIVARDRSVPRSRDNGASGESTEHLDECPPLGYSSSNRSCGEAAVSSDGVLVCPGCCVIPANVEASADIRRPTSAHTSLLSLILCGNKARRWRLPKVRAYGDSPITRAAAKRL